MTSYDCYKADKSDLQLGNIRGISPEILRRIYQAGLYDRQAIINAGVSGLSMRVKGIGPKLAKDIIWFLQEENGTEK